MRGLKLRIRNAFKGMKSIVKGYRQKIRLRQKPQQKNHAVKAEQHPPALPGPNRLYAAKRIIDDGSYRREQKKRYRTVSHLVSTILPKPTSDFSSEKCNGQIHNAVRCGTVI